MSFCDMILSPSPSPPSTAYTVYLDHCSEYNGTRFSVPRIVDSLTDGRAGGFTAWQRKENGEDDRDPENSHHPMIWW